MNLFFEEVTLTVVDLFASTVKKVSCSSLEQCHALRYGIITYW